MQHTLIIDEDIVQILAECGSELQALSGETLARRELELGWKPRWNLATTMGKIVECNDSSAQGFAQMSIKQIRNYSE